MTGAVEHQYLLVTSNTFDVIMCIVQQGSKVQLPNTRDHWPTLRPKPQRHWYTKLLHHISYGLYDATKAKVHKVSKIFGVQGAVVYLVVLDSNILQNVVHQAEQVFQWSKQACKCAHFLRLRLLTQEECTNQSSVPLMDAHCITWFFREANLLHTKMCVSESDDDKTKLDASETQVNLY